MSLSYRDGIWYWGTHKFDLDNKEGLVQALKVGMYEEGPKRVMDIIRGRKDVRKNDYDAAYNEYIKETEGK